MIPWIPDSSNIEPMYPGDMVSSRSSENFVVLWVDDPDMPGGARFISRVKRGDVFLVIADDASDNVFTLLGVNVLGKVGRAFFERVNETR